jgi:hypothetical protein
LASHCHSLPSLLALVAGPCAAGQGWLDLYEGPAPSYPGSAGRET